MTTPIARGVEHRCSRAQFASCLGPTSGRPRRQKCPYCGSALIVSEGTYAVVEWRGDGRYNVDQAVATYAREPAARRRSEAEGDTFVVRFLTF